MISTPRIAILLFTLFWMASPKVYGQVADSLPLYEQLEPVEITAYFNRQPIVGLTASGQVISKQNIDIQQTTSLLSALNTVAGLRMEERSPGSYRMAMRGSLIRSPFGIRNVKIYIDEFPLTDAGGNTYLNLLDPASISSIYVLKGADGSLYGANSGGVIRIQPNGFDVSSNQNSLLLQGGSFGLFQEQLSLQRTINDNYSFSVDQSFIHSDGYRANADLSKKTFQTAHKWQYSPRNELRFLALYTDLNYRTPGGLTESQRKENPRMARPDAVKQQAGIYNKTFFGGIAHDARITHKLSHTVSISGSYTDFENPFITNYEFRKEENIGVRTYFSYSGTIGEQHQWQMQLGFEGQRGWYKINNYDNGQGAATTPQAMTDLQNIHTSIFYRIMVQLHKRWTIEASLGLNKAKTGYHQHYPAIPIPRSDISFEAALMPRVAASYLLGEGFAVRTSVSKGYSPPTIAEVRSSDTTINTGLRPETGINYEIGMRLQTSDRRFIADLSFYHYTMNDGIVRHLHDNGAEYYVNAGEMKQRGIETSLWAYLLPIHDDRLVRTLKLQSSVSYHHYRFGNYQPNGNDYTHNKITAVPDWVWTNTLRIAFAKQIGVNISHLYTSSMPLNDANTVFADKFHLIQLKTTWDIAISKRKKIQFFVGIDNLADEQYSLGNDINAFANRFFNPAPARNFYAGAKISL
ncbi:MAG: TonB-dependent receptor [Capnocytophaga sp.]|nr:TonB-dependent receptor [Capnocytophaga sp.]